MCQDAKNYIDRKECSEMTSYKTGKKNKILLFYNVQFVSTLNKGALIF